jgi:O-antigen/teichoic acid export membrane protein
MTQIRRAFLLASVEQYLVLAINLLMVAILARFLMPREIGLAVIGMGLSATIFSIREFASPEFLIQQTEITQDDIRTTYTAMVFITGVLGLILAISAPQVARFYGEEGLSKFLSVMIIAAAIDSAAQPGIALLRRGMEFATLARIRTTASMAMHGACWPVPAPPRFWPFRSGLRDCCFRR